MEIFRIKKFIYFNERIFWLAFVNKKLEIIEESSSNGVIGFTLDVVTYPKEILMCLYFQFKETLNTLWEYYTEAANNLNTCLLYSINAKYFTENIKNPITFFPDTVSFKFSLEENSDDYYIYDNMSGEVTNLKTKEKTKSFDFIKDINSIYFIHTILPEKISKWFEEKN